MIFSYVAYDGIQTSGSFGPAQVSDLVVDNGGPGGNDLAEEP
ncbi:MAG: hypothetical protein ACRDTC_15005 [Pseudonocardiaceae bacterium]